MTNRPTVRRSIVAIGLLVTVFAAVATMRGAAMWAATSAPLDEPPVAVAELQRALLDEQARSAALTEELNQLQEAAAGMHEALSAAEGQMTTDQTTADELRTSLEAAQLRLANVEKALAAAKARLAKAGSSGTTSAGTSSGGEREYEDEHDDD